jgi:hypothetical protein
MKHGLMYSGAFETNYPHLQAGARTFVGSDGAEHVHMAWPSEVDGLRVWYMEKPGKHFVAVRVQDDAADLVLSNPVLLEPSRHMGHGKRFSPEPTVVDDEMILVLLADALGRNPDLRAELHAMRERMRPA